MEFLTIFCDYCKIFFSSILTCFPSGEEKQGLLRPLPRARFRPKKRKKSLCFPKKAKGENH